MASFGFVCFAVMLATGAALEVTGRCPSGWTIFDETSSCYKVFTRKNFADAEQACVKVGAHLASVHSQNENSFLLEIAQSGYKGDDIDKVYLQSGTWIGLRTTDKDKAFQWTDSTKVDFTAWKSVEPNNRETEHCVELLADGSSSVDEWFQGWNNYVCNEVIRNFVCKKGLTAPVQRTEVKECPSQWKLFKGSCYKVGGKGNWEQAEAACEKDGAELVSIHSANENSFLINITKTGQSYVSAYEESVWIGMKLASDGAWKWSDGTKADYDAWAEGEPNFKEEGCGALGVDRYDKWNDRWNNLYCNRTLRAFVCKKTGNSVFVELD